MRLIFQQFYHDNESNKKYTVVYPGTEMVKKMHGSLLRSPFPAVYSFPPQSRSWVFARARAY